MPVAQQKHGGPLDTHFRDDSMNKNKLFGGNVKKRSRSFFKPLMRVERA